MSSGGSTRCSVGPAERPQEARRRTGQRRPNSQLGRTTATGLTPHLLGGHLLRTFAFAREEDGVPETRDLVLLDV